MSLYIAIIIAYSIGSIPFGLLISKILGKTDPRIAGSGNIGATNMLRLNGKIAGLATLFADALKGVLAIVIAARFSNHNDIIFFAGLAAFIGHIYPIWLKFRGGKGIATGIAVAITWGVASGSLMIATFALVLWWKRYVSLAALSAAALAPFFVYMLSSNLVHLACISIMTLLIFIRHRQNIKNLKAGLENKI